MAKIALIPKLLEFSVPRPLSLGIDVKLFFKSHFENRGGRLSDPYPDWLTLIL